ncbi:cytochrome b [Methylobacterium sp. C25]|uniref:cytochrome b n=1 Tax=Methylobacterium sp. C25 TaxID=2721622 RepID=UPI001F33114F|nr:cytochrome b/b6 domain-containing protein [Methylobacterium sp. C25]MCE4226807.1 cytochrome b [Methylobacterium sp. C25]
MKTSEARHDRVTILLHWLTAGLVAVLWLVGTFLEDLLAKGPLRSGIWSAHVDAGFVLTGIMVSAMIWRSTRGLSLPPESAGALRALAKSTHAALALLLVVVITLGIANALVRGFTLAGPIKLPQLGNIDWRRPLTRWHGWAAHVLMAVALFHATAALVHHYLWKDDVLRRMLPRSKEQRLTGRP